MKTYAEMEVQLHTFLTLAALPPWKRRFTLDRRLGGHQGRSGRGGEGKKPLPLPGVEPRSSSQ